MPVLFGPGSGAGGHRVDRAGWLGEFLQDRDPLRRFRQPLARERSGACATGDGVDRVVLVPEGVTDEDCVAPRADRELSRVGHAPGLGDGAHLQVIGDAAALELDVLAQQLERDRRERRRQPVEGLETDVRGHDRCEPGPRRRHEWHQLDFPQPPLVVRQPRQCEV